jgi:hypothetical protein
VIAGLLLVAATSLHPCSAQQLAIAVGPEQTEATGQHTVTYRLRNVGTSACALAGYPQIALRDAAGTLPFRITHRGDQMITARRPVPFGLRARGVAFFALNKYRCDRGDLRRARTLRLTLGGRTATAPVPRAADIAYCGRGDPGTSVAVSPFELTLRAALRRH